MTNRLLTLFLITILGGTVMAKDFEQPFGKGEINPYNKFFTGTTYLKPR